LATALVAFSALKGAPPRLVASMKAELGRAEFALGNHARAVEHRTNRPRFGSTSE
jgi:hypothetical protein